MRRRKSGVTGAICLPKCRQCQLPVPTFWHWHYGTAKVNLGGRACPQLGWLKAITDINSLIIQSSSSFSQIAFLIRSLQVFCFLSRDFSYSTLTLLETNYILANLGSHRRRRSRRTNWIIKSTKSRGKRDVKNN